MKVGDLVKSIFLHGDTRGYYPSGHMGIIVAKVDEPRATGLDLWRTTDSDVFKVVWVCGGVSENMWDYDLEKVSA